MRLTFLGCGYVGLVSGACFSSTGNHVCCVDLDPAKIELLKRRELPIYEPALEALLGDAGDRLEFTDDVSAAIRFAEIIFVCVGTEEKPDGSANVDGVFSCLEKILDLASEPKIIVIKSTVPVGTADKCRERARKSELKHAIISNPEFLKEGNAVNDFLKPDRVVIGAGIEPEDARARECLAFLYQPFMRKSDRLLFVSNRSAELIKYAANAFLATKVSFINEIALLCEKLGADIHEVRHGLTSDHRIGEEFLFPGPGFGGSCFPKDLHSLIVQSKKNDFAFEVAAAADRANQRQKGVVFQKLVRLLGDQIKDSQIAIWGAAFKANTDDIRESPAMALIHQLLSASATIRLFDPKAVENVKDVLGKRILYFSDPYDALSGADVWCVMTEWQQFRTPDFTRIKQLLRRPIIVDGRNLYERSFLEKQGFEYHGIGV